MNNSIQAKLQIFVANEKLSKSDFPWQIAVSKRLAALLYALENKEIDIPAIKSCYSMIKNSSSVFSAFRGTMALCIAALFSLNPNPEELLEKSKTAYKVLKEANFWPSEHLTVASAMIAINGGEGQIEAVASRSRAFYDEMKKRHYFLTSNDDVIFAIMLGLSDCDVEAASEKLEMIYQQLKPEFFSANSVQAISQILTLSSQGEQMANRVIELKNAFVNRKIRLDRMESSPTLGVLALLPASTEALVEDLSDAVSYFKSEKILASWSIDTQQFLICAAALVASGYSENLKDNVLTASLATSVANIIIAQQAVMISVISSATTMAVIANN